MFKKRVIKIYGMIFTLEALLLKDMLIKIIGEMIFCNISLVVQFHDSNFTDFSQ